MEIKEHATTLASFGAFRGDYNEGVHHDRLREIANLLFEALIVMVCV